MCHVVTVSGFVVLTRAGTMAWGASDYDYDHAECVIVSAGPEQSTEAGR